MGSAEEPSGEEAKIATFLHTVDALNDSIPTRFKMRLNRQNLRQFRAAWT